MLAMCCVTHSNILTHMSALTPVNHSIHTPRVGGRLFTTQSTQVVPVERPPPTSPIPAGSVRLPLVSDVSREAWVQLLGLAQAKKVRQHAAPGLALLGGGFACRFACRARCWFLHSSGGCGHARQKALPGHCVCLCSVG